MRSQTAPFGWAAYMLDKWQKWTDTRTRTFQVIFDQEHLLTEMMLFLVTDSVATSALAIRGFPDGTLRPFAWSKNHRSFRLLFLCRSAAAARPAPFRRAFAHQHQALAGARKQRSLPDAGSHRDACSRYSCLCRSRRELTTSNPLESIVSKIEII